jgi:hypothetical protein
MRNKLLFDLTFIFCRGVQAANVSGIYKKNI